MTKTPRVPQQVSLVAPIPRQHILIAGDSAKCDYKPGFDLLLTSPPYFHTARDSLRHGIGYVGNLDHYVDFVANVLCKVSAAVRERRMCVIKTDFWHKGVLVPVGYAIMNGCIKRGMQLRAHWVWERAGYYSPYGPSFTNIFVFADQFSRPRFGGVIHKKGQKRTLREPESLPLEPYAFLIDLLTQPGNTLIDPFAGIGTTLHAAASAGRFSVGVEVSRAQVRKALQRLKGIPGFAFGVTSAGTISHQKETGHERQFGGTA